jgi:hypothetical protein
MPTNIAFDINWDLQSTKAVSFNLRVNNRNWHLTLAWSDYRKGKRYPFPVRVTPYFSYQPDLNAIESDCENHHKDCCGWTPTSHCGRFEGA